MRESPAYALRDRAVEWAREDERVGAAFVYGSVAQGKAHAYSDLDLVVVAQSGQRDALWDERRQIVARILGETPVYEQEVPWQRPFRFQAWGQGLVPVDLTFDEGQAEVWGGHTHGWELLVDRIGAEAQLREAVADWKREEFNAPVFNLGTWPWLLWMHGRLAHGQHWGVRVGLMDTLGNRVVPLLGTNPYRVEGTLSSADTEALHAAAPRSDDPDELARALLATAELYARSLSRWSERTGEPRPTHPLEAGTLALLRRGRS